MEWNGSPDFQKAGELELDLPTASCDNLLLEALQIILSLQAGKLALGPVYLEVHQLVKEEC